MMSGENHITTIVYGFIRDEDYDEAVSYLNTQLLTQPSSRAALSLLGYCYYNMHEYDRAAEIYQKLIRMFPKQYDYYINMSQSLLLTGKLEAAEETIERIPHARRDEKIHLLQANIKFEKGDWSGSKALLRSIKPSDEVLLAQAAILSKEGRFEEAMEKYDLQTGTTIGFRPDVAYSKALSHYRMDQMESALVIIDEIILRSHTTEEMETNDYRFDDKMDKSSLFESYLVEALNLKAAIEYGSGQINEARQTWNKMPARGDEDIDAVSLHNQGIIHMDSDTTGGFGKLTYLLRNPPYPPETFANILIMYCAYGFEDKAADAIAENEHLLQTYVTSSLFQFLDAFIIMKASAEEALRRFEKAAANVTHNIKKWKKRIQELKKREDRSTELRHALAGLKEGMDVFVPIVMIQSKIYWDRFDYENAVKILESAADICSNTDEWKLNMAHALFMQQGDKYNDAIRYYTDIIEAQSRKNLINVSPIAIANACVAYIMTKRNDEAESLLEQLKQQEESCESHHNCIVNLVIGTLYCEQGQFEFGIQSICKSLQPFEEKLGADTWYYAKLCLLALADKVAKQMVVLTQQLNQSIQRLLDETYDHGTNILATMDIEQEGSECKSTISDDARRLKYIFLQLATDY